MTLKKAIKILNQHNEWKKDNSIPKKIKIVNPIELGLVYDFMLTMEKHCDNRCDMNELDDDINIEINYKSDYEKKICSIFREYILP